MGLEGGPAFGPGGLEASLGPCLDQGGHPGPLHLVAEERPPDPARRALVLAQMAVLVDPGAPGRLVLCAARGGDERGGGRGQFVVRRPGPGQLQQGLGTPRGRRLGVSEHGELGAGQCAALEGLGQRRIGTGRRGGGQAVLGDRGRGPTDRAQPVGGHAMADLGVGPGMEHPGAEQGNARGGGPFGLGEQVHQHQGFIARERRRRRRPQHRLHLAQGGFERPDRSGDARTGNGGKGDARTGEGGRSEGGKGHTRTLERGCDTPPVYPSKSEITVSRDEAALSTRQENPATGIHRNGNRERGKRRSGGS